MGAVWVQNTAVWWITGTWAGLAGEPVTAPDKALDGRQRPILGKENVAHFQATFSSI
jgi:hypothetical protein